MEAGAAGFTLREPGVGDLGWVVARHGVVHHESYGWDVSFEALVAGVVGRFAQAHADSGSAALLGALLSG